MTAFMAVEDEQDVCEFQDNSGSWSSVEFSWKQM